MDCGMLTLKTDGRKFPILDVRMLIVRHTDPNFVPFPTETYPKNPTGPDELDPDKFVWPDAHVVPFHYRTSQSEVDLTCVAHPITGKWLTEEERIATKR